MIGAGVAVALVIILFVILIIFGIISLTYFF